MRFTDLFRPKIGPDGEIELVPESSRKKPGLIKEEIDAQSAWQETKLQEGNS
jgi:hypothetical protein